MLCKVKNAFMDQKKWIILQTVRPTVGETQTKQTLLSDYGISSSPKAAKVEVSTSSKHGPLVEVKLEPGLPPKVGRLDDGCFFFLLFSVCLFVYLFVWLEPGLPPIGWQT